MDVLRLLVFLTALAGRLVWKLLKLLAAGLRLMFRQRPTTFGSARWATWWQAVTVGALGGHSGLIIGKAWGSFLRFKGEGAVLVVAPQGSGKGAGIVVPNLLDYPGSVICTDPKGENAHTTGRHRAKLGPVYRLNAIDPEISDRFNPFSMVRQGTAMEFDDAEMLADLIITPESAEAHWDTSAKQVLAAMIMYLLRTRPPELQTLSALNDLVNAEPETLKATFKAMAARPEAAISSKGRQALGAIEFEEFRSVINNAGKALNLFAEDRIAARLTATSDFDLMDVHRGTMTVYVMVPEELLATYAPFFRVMVGCTLAALVRGKSLARPRHKPMLLVDECQNLGRLEALERAMGLLREYARMVVVFQDLGRLRKLYGEDGAVTFIANSGAQVAFGVNDLRGASDLASMLGMQTVETRSEGVSQANTDLLRYQQQAGSSEAGRHLLDASEILRLSPKKAIVRLNTVRAPILAAKVRYWKEGRWRGLWDRWRATDAVPVHADAGAPAGEQALPAISTSLDSPDIPARYRFDRIDHCRETSGEQ